MKEKLPNKAKKDESAYNDYLAKVKGDHDVLLLVEWSDGVISELPANYDSEAGIYRCANDLQFKVAGKGTEPKSYHDVPVVRVYAALGCPIDTTAAIAADRDEAGTFEVVTDQYDRRKVVQHLPVRTDEDGEPVTDDDGSLVADGGHIAGNETNRVYDLNPPEGCVGWSFELKNASDRAPYGVNPEELKNSEERGKRAVRGEDSRIKDFLLGGGCVLLVLLFIAVALWLVGAL